MIQYLRIENTEKYFRIEFQKRIENEWKINQFFNDRHRAEILKGMPFSSKFVKDLIKKMREFREKNNLNDNGNFSVQTFQDLMNYIGMMKVNYMKYFDFIMGKFILNFQVCLISTLSQRGI